MDRVLRANLKAAKRDCRTGHGAVLEEAALAWEAYLKSHGGHWQRLRRRDLTGFFGVWLIRRYGDGVQGKWVKSLLAACVILLRLRVAHRPQAASSLVALGRRAARHCWQALHAVDSFPEHDVSFTDSSSRVLSERVAKGDRRRPAAKLARPEKQNLEEDYWEVLICGRRHLVLRSLRQGSVVGPIALPEAFVAALSPGVIINLELGRQDESYVVMQHGYCYPASAAKTLREESDWFEGAR